MMNRTMQLNGSAVLTLSSVSALSSFAFDVVRFFSGLRFYFYYFYAQSLPSERPSVS